MAEIVKPSDRRQTVQDLLTKLKPQVMATLPKHLTPDRFLRVMFNQMGRSVTKATTLYDCTPQSLAGALMTCTTLGLEPDDVQGLAYLIPFRNNKKGVVECQLIIGYKGLIELALRSGQVSYIEGRTVQDGDQFSYQYGTDPFLHHVPAAERKPGGKLTYFYCIARMKDGTYRFEVRNVAEIEAVRGRSKSPNDGPWVSDFSAMAVKTVVRQTCKFLPYSTNELRTAVALDELDETEVSQNLESQFQLPPDLLGEDRPKGSALEQLTEKLKNGESQPRPTPTEEKTVAEQQENPLDRLDRAIDLAQTGEQLAEILTELDALPKKSKFSKDERARWEKLVYRLNDRNKEMESEKTDTN